MDSEKKEIRRSLRSGNSLIEPMPKGDAFRKYLQAFEEQVIINGFEQGFFSQHILVPVRHGRLSSTRFGKLMGISFDYPKALVIDYYGLLKKSEGFYLTLAQNPGEYQVKMFWSPIVYFASVRIEDISYLAPDLVIGFSAFKERILIERGFRKPPQHIGKKGE